MSRVAILGSGKVGRAIADRLQRAGHSVRLGGRAEGGLPDVLPVPAAARDADVLILTVPASAAVDVVREASPGARILLDCTNPIRWQDGPVWAPPEEGSVAAQLAAAFPDTPVVKGLNHFGVEIHRDPALSSGPADACFASDRVEAKRVVMRLAEEAGFRTVDAGPLRNAALLENLAVLWIQLAMGGDREFAFRIEGRSR